MWIEHFICECYSPEHTLRFLYIEEEPKEIFATIHLGNNNNFFKRVWYGLKYIFGYQCRYGHFDEFCIRPEDARQMIFFLEEFEKKREKTKEEFLELVRDWGKNTGMLSNPRTIMSYPQVSILKTFGEKCIPWAFEEMRLNPWGMFMLIREILQDGPEIPKEDLGKVEQVKEHWYAWGKEKGYVE